MATFTQLRCRLRAQLLGQKIVKVLTTPIDWGHIFVQYGWACGWIVGTIGILWLGQLGGKAGIDHGLQSIVALLVTFTGFSISCIASHFQGLEGGTRIAAQFIDQAQQFNTQNEAAYNELVATLTARIESEFNNQVQVSISAERSTTGDGQSGLDLRVQASRIPPSNPPEGSAGPPLTIPPPPSPIMDLTQQQQQPPQQEPATP